MLSLLLLRFVLKDLALLINEFLLSFLEKLPFSLFLGIGLSLLGVLVLLLFQGEIS